MQQLLILSGKGGTGKTTITGAFIKLAKARAYADCDVDAPNLHLALNLSSQPQLDDFYGLDKAEIDGEICTECGLCRDHCRFGAIEIGQGGYTVNSFACEGCGVCQAVCPQGAVTMAPAVAGELKLYEEGTVFSTAQLRMGSGNSGMLVSEVKRRMRDAARDCEWAIIDGSPGIGCPVIASLSGVDMVLIVAEPSLSGISDMERILKTAGQFQTKAAVCVNKYDVNRENTRRIQEFCTNRALPFLGVIPFDSNVVKAVNAGQSVVDIDCPAGRAVKEVYLRTLEILKGNRNY